jgi:hypothetical protein
MVLTRRIGRPATPTIINVITPKTGAINAWKNKAADPSIPHSESKAAHIM